MKTLIGVVVTLAKFTQKRQNLNQEKRLILSKKC